MPLDEALGIDLLPFKMSPGFMLECAFWAQNQKSYEAAEAMIARVTGVRTNDDTIRQVVNTVGKLVFDEDFFDEDCRRVDETMEKLEKHELHFPRTRKGTLYMAVDETALKTRQKKDEGATCKVGIVITSDNITSTRNETTNKLEYTIEKKEYVPYLGDTDEFKRHLFHCAVKNGYGQYEKTVILNNGAPWIANMASELFCDAVHILDLFHLGEHVHAYAKEKFAFDESKHEPWSQKTIRLLKDGKACEVIEELKNDSPINDKNCVDLQHCLKQNGNHIKYPEYMKQGFLVDSGAIENLDKGVLQSRLNQAGMRWEVTTAQYLLTLRAKSESGLWESDVVELARRTWDIAMRRQ